MNALETLFLTITGAAIQGKALPEPPGLSQADCAALLDMAQNQRIVPLFYETVYQWEAFRQAPLADQTRRQVRQQVLTQTLRTEEFLQLNRKLCQAGLRPLVVKGLVCRNLYPHPDHRPSGDEDVLIVTEELGQYQACFASFGLHPTSAKADASCYEIPYRKANSPLYIELHQSLFPPDSEAYGDLNRFFRDAARNPVALDVPGGPVWTMGYTEHLLYLLLHAFKHFLHSGFGIRQLCDMVLFANRYGSQIQWERLVVCCQAVRAETFAIALFAIGREYFGFDPEAACYPPQWRNRPVEVEPMLEDLLAGGLYGYQSMSRRHSSTMTLEAVAAQKKGKKPGKLARSTLFPPARNLQGRYPYLRGKPWLLPVAWCSRIVSYQVNRRREPDNTPGQALKIGKARVALLQKYDIIS